MKNSIFVEKLELCCQTRGIKRTTFCKDFGINEATVRTWIRNGNYPQADVLYRISQYFGVPMEYFMDGSENPFSDRELVLLVKTKSLSDEQVRMLLLMAEKFAEENEKLKK